LSDVLQVANRTPFATAQKPDELSPPITTQLLRPVVRNVYEHNGACQQSTNLAVC
jgi:hypothetical protein